MFTHFWVLGLLVIPLLIVAWVWLRERGRIVLPFDHGRQRSGMGAKITIHIFESLPALVLAVVIILLAGPQRLDEPKAKRMLTNIEFCVDVSRSMSWPLGDGTRYDASMKAIDEFLDFRKGDAFGLTFFGNSVLHWVPLTSDISAIRCAPPFMEPKKVPEWMAGTMIGKALLACREVLAERQEGDRMIILISDGDSYDLENENDIRIAKQLKQDNIVVYSIHISNTEVPGPIANITTITGGQVFEVGDPSALKTVFQRIDQMQQTKLEKTMAESMDFFEPFCIVGLFVLGLVGIGWFGLRYTPW